MSFDVSKLKEFFRFNTTKEIPVPKKVIDQIIGQDHAVEIIKRAANQRRHVLLIGEPGTGKSMLAQAMAELLSENKENIKELEDILVFPNPQDEFQPIVKTVPAGQGRLIVNQYKKQFTDKMQKIQLFYSILMLIVILTPWYFYYIGDKIMAAATFIGSMLFLAGFSLSIQMIQRQIMKNVPKLLVDNSGRKTVPFVDATGAHEGMLFGDVLHDPFQSFSKDCLVWIVNKKKNCSYLINISDFINFMIKRHKDKVLIKNYKDFRYIAVDLRGEEYYTYTLDKDGKLKETKILFVNKRIGEFDLIPISYKNRFISLTPEHKIYIKDWDLIEARDYKKEELITSDFNLLTELDIVKTFGKKELEKYYQYIKWKEFKEKNPEVGWKKASKILRIPESKTRWWEKGMKPYSIKIIEKLKGLNLVPLKIDDERLPTIARIYGYLLGDGNIDKRINNLSIISSDKTILFKLVDDMKKVFGEFSYEIIENKSSYGKSFIFRTQEKYIIRFFVALGFPAGTKTTKKIRIPKFILARKDTIIEFLRGFFESDGGTPSVSNKSYIEGLLSFSITCKNKKLLKNRKVFLGDIKRLLEYFGIKVRGISIREYGRGYLLRLIISHKPSNVKKFLDLFFPIYNVKKREKIEKSINYIVERRGKEVLEQTILADPKTKVTYNITTETGNLIVNGILVKNSGGLETPAHLRVIPGAIHRAHKGVLFIDEIGTLRPETQIELLTVLQEKKYPIYGRSERSAGSMVRTTPAPADFTLVAAGNIETLKYLHPALRSRIRGYGYEVLMNSEIEFNEDTAFKFAQFVAQEVKKDGKIPHFTKDAVIEIIKEAQRRSGRKGYLTLRLRDLGGLIRLSGDIAKSKGKEFVEPEDVLEAKEKASTLEEKLSRDYIKKKKEYQLIKTTGYEIGRVNGLAVIGSRLFYSGIVLPVEAEVVPGTGKGKIIATGNLGKIAREAIINVSAVIKKLFNEDLKKYDVHVQFLQAYEGVEGDSASITVATAIISALKGWKVRQDVAMTGSLSIRGEVLPVGGIIPKIEAAIDSGLKEVLIPEMNLRDVPDDLFEKIKITPVSTIKDVIKFAIRKSRTTKK